MKIVLGSILLAGIWATAARASDDLKMPVNLDRLAEHATESVNLDLDSSMLQLASGFLSKDDPDQIKVKKLVSKLKGIYVRNFEFEKEGQYSRGEIEALRSQLKAPGWTRVVGVMSKGDNTEIFLKKTGDVVAGLVVIDAEPKELTIVHIDGPINPEELNELGGHMGIPRIERWGSEKSPAKHEE